MYGNQYVMVPQVASYWFTERLAAAQRLVDDDTVDTVSMMYLGEWLLNVIMFCIVSFKMSLKEITRNIYFYIS